MNVTDKKDSTLFSSFKKETIANILTKSNIDKEYINDMEITLAKLFDLLNIISIDFGKQENIKIKNQIFDYLEILGINRLSIKKEYDLYIKNENLENFILDDICYKEYNDFLNNVNKIILSKCDGISDKYMKNLIKTLKLSYMYNDIKFEIIKNKNIVMINMDEVRKEWLVGIINELTDISKLTTTSKFSQKKQSYKDVNISKSDFKGKFNVAIVSSSRRFKEKLLFEIMKECNLLLSTLLNDIKDLKTILINNYKYNINALIPKFPLNYNKQSMKAVMEKKLNEREYLLELFGPDNLSQLERLVNILNQNKDKKDHDLYNRLSIFTVDGWLMNEVQNIINDQILDNYNKQIAIEKISLEYDLTWFKQEMKESLGARSVILHDIYKCVNTNLKYITLHYTNNNGIKIKKLMNKLDLHDLNNRESIKLICVLIILILGNDSVISTSFKNIIELTTKSDEGMKVKRTELLFKVGGQLIKFALYKLNKIYNIIANNKNTMSGETTMSGESTMSVQGKRRIFEIEDIERIKNILKLIPFEDLNKIINYFKDSEIGKFELGDTIVNILENKTNVLDRIFEYKNNDKEVFITIKDDYKKKLNISVINVTQLPMLIQPNSPDNMGNYLPYIQGEISHIYNTFDTVIKHKHGIRDQIENQHVLNKTITYLNNTPFYINTEVLDFILNEWNTDNSVYFSGFNRLQEVNIDDSEDIKRQKQSHNSKYWRYLNIINLATVYRNEVFYLPTFADFRGRVYTLTQYLTYQGDDLCRSLLLFANEKEKLTEKGFKYLLFYFANLYNNKELDYNERITWSKNNISNIYNMFMTDKEKFNTNILSNVKEPFQFISIMLALIKCIKSFYNNEEIILDNPILFDASCNGLQHLSALTRELDIAKNTNLIYLNNLGEKDVKKDIYTLVSSLVQEEIDKNDNIKLRELKISRDMVKRTVMTIPYNISIYGVKEQMRDLFIEHKELNKLLYKVEGKYTKDSKIKYLFPSDVNILGELVYETILTKLPSLRILNEYLDQLLLVLAKLNKPVIWITPSGLKITLSNVKYESIRTSSSLLPYGKPVTISIPTNRLNTTKNKTSFMPNLVHSLDASNIHLLCENLNYEPLYTIHDCFATTANNMKNIENRVKEAFIKIYFTNGNYLEKMHLNIIEQIKSYSPIFEDKDGNSYITINKIDYVLPNLPQSFINPELVEIFTKGIMNSKFFIS